MPAYTTLQRDRVHACWLVCFEHLLPMLLPFRQCHLYLESDSHRISAACSCSSGSPFSISSFSPSDHLSALNSAPICCSFRPAFCFQLEFLTRISHRCWYPTILAGSSTILAFEIRRSRLNQVLKWRCLISAFDWMYRFQGFGNAFRLVYLAFLSSSGPVFCCCRGCDCQPHTLSQLRLHQSETCLVLAF